ncbi:MAG: hypothetical protein ACI957_004510 [Verrucomicrobiales bacterium]
MLLTDEPTGVGFNRRRRALALPSNEIRGGLKSPGAADGQWLSEAKCEIASRGEGEIEGMPHGTRFGWAGRLRLDGDLILCATACTIVVEPKIADGEGPSLLA